MGVWQGEKIWLFPSHKLFRYVPFFQIVSCFSLTNYMWADTLKAPVCNITVCLCWHNLIHVHSDLEARTNTDLLSGNLLTRDLLHCCFPHENALRWSENRVVPLEGNLCQASYDLPRNNTWQHRNSLSNTNWTRWKTLQSQFGRNLFLSFIINKP